MLAITYFAIGYIIYGGILVWRDFHTNFSDRPLYAMEKYPNVIIIIRAIFVRPCLTPLYYVKTLLAEIKRDREIEKAKYEKRLEEERVENKQALEDLKEIKFLKNNIRNSELIMDGGGHLPIEASEIGLVVINDNNKTIKIEVKQTGTKCIREGGAIYQVPCYSTGHLLCENADYKIIESAYGDVISMREDEKMPGRLILRDNVFVLCNDEKNPSKLSLTISINSRGVVIICDKISVIDFNDVKITDMDEYRDIVVGCSYGKYFSIQYDKQ